MKTFTQCATLVPRQAPDKRSEKKDRVQGGTRSIKFQQDSLDMDNITDGGFGPQYDRDRKMHLDGLGVWHGRY